MALDPNIILSGVQPNFLAGIQQANQAAAQQNGFQREQAMNQLYQTQGAGIANGDPAALNALAGFSPQAAVDIRGAQQNMAFDAEKMDYFRQDAKAKAAANVASLSAAEAAAKAAKIDQAIAAGTAAQNPDQWDQTMRSFGAPEYVGQFENRGQIIASAMGVKDALEAAADERKAAQAAALGPEWRPATPEEAAAQGAQFGQVNGRTGEFRAAKLPNNMSITTNPDGTMSFSQGSGIGGKPFTEAQSKDIGFAARAEPANSQLDEIGNILTGRVDQALGSVPLGIARGLQNPEYQKAERAAKELATTMLRKDSGAAINAGEYTDFYTAYIPQPGDSSALLEDKKSARARLVAGLKAGMSPEAVMRQEGAIGAAPPPSKGDAAAGDFTLSPEAQRLFDSVNQ